MRLFGGILSVCNWASLSKYLQELVVEWAVLSPFEPTFWLSDVRHQKIDQSCLPSAHPSKEFSQITYHM